MTEPHLGNLIKLLRRSRGMSQKDTAKTAGVSPPTLRTIETSPTLSVRPSSLELILLAISSRARLTTEEISELVDASPVDRSFLDRMNIHSSEVHPVIDRNRPSLKDRASKAFDRLIAAGLDESTVSILEALADRVGSSPASTNAEHTESENPPEPGTKRRLRVLHPERPGPMPGSTIQDITNYVVDDDDEQTDQQNQEGAG